MRATEFLSEIERLTKGDYTGGKDSLYDKKAVNMRPLPGGSGLTYSIVPVPTRKGREYYAIKIFDPNGTGDLNKPVKEPDESAAEFQQRVREYQQLQKQQGGQLIANLSVYSGANNFPLKGALQVDNITVDEDYRGMGLAKALYGIVLTIMKRPLLAGSAQTPGGRRNWVSLSQIPGVETKGYVAFEPDFFDPDYNDDNWAKKQNKIMGDTIDTIMGKLGGQYMGRGNGEYGLHYFAFDVQPTTTGQELESYVNTNLSKVYTNRFEFETGLYAVWAGK